MAQTRVRCQRIGCDATFSPDENEDESACTYHPGPPLFHDGGKEWSCCKKRSHDFSLFLDIPGCKQGKHTTEKPVLPSLSKPKPQTVVQGKADQTITCSRCRQGFFCSDHGNTVQKAAPAAPLKPSPPPASISTQTSPAQDVSAKPAPPKVVNLDEKQKCKNHGCGNIFTERENHDTACNFHPGPPVFHDRSRGWACCDVHVKEFDEFMEIPPCTKGWHSPA